MTREEAIKILRYNSNVIHQTMNGETDPKEVEALDMAIKALEQEPKTGHWIAQDIHNCHTNFKCSVCGYMHDFMHLYGKPTADYTYCPSCGARMVEPKEKRCADCNHYGELSLDCGRCDDCSMFEPQESEEV